jgi:hypothetical protein
MDALKSMLSPLGVGSANAIQDTLVRRLRSGVIIVLTQNVRDRNLLSSVGLLKRPEEPQREHGIPSSTVWNAPESTEYQ